MKPLSGATQRATAGVRYMTGIDGIRRPIIAGPAPALRAATLPTPRQVLESLAAPSAMPLAPTVTTEPAAEPLATLRPWHRRPAIAFSLVATALIASSAAAITLSSNRTAAAQAAASAPNPKPRTAAPAAAASPTSDQRQLALQQLLNQFVATQSTGGHFNIMVKDLGTGISASINPDQSFASASLYKLFVADQIYRLLDTGQLTYSSAAGGGSNNNVQGCLNLMITISDNTCGRALGDILDWGDQNPAITTDGYTETNLTTPQQTSARDVSMLLERLYNGTLNSPSSNDAFMSLLKAQKVNDRLPLGLPVGTVIAHKTGNLDDVVHDAGIVYGPKTNYLVVVMSGGWSLPGDVPPKFATLSQQLWNFFEQQ